MALLLSQEPEFQKLDLDRVIRMCLRAAEILFSLITGLISVAYFLSSVISWLRRLRNRSEARSA